MENITRLKKRFETSAKALKNLEKVIGKYVSTSTNDEDLEYFRESLIKRFEYTLELFWKLLKDYLEEMEGATVSSSPRGVISDAKTSGIITEEQSKLLNNMIDDRNLSSHAYHENIAIKIANDVVHYFATLRYIHEKIRDKIK